MKKLIIILIALGFISLYCQDKEPIQQLFNLKIGNDLTPKYLSADMDYFTQKKFILGWAWSNGRKMSEALLDNQAHIGGHSSDNIKKNVKDSTYLIINCANITDNGDDSTASNSQSVWYSPILKIINPGTMLDLRTNDPRKLIYGFRYIQGENISSSDTCLKLRRSGSSYIGYDKKVLDSAWNDNVLYHYIPNRNRNFMHFFNTEKLYFSINLCRAAGDSNIKDSARVLKIKLPFKIGNQVRSIIFSKLPDDIANDNFEIRNSLTPYQTRGYATNLYDQEDSIFYITRNMLPNANIGNITISAFFYCVGYPNPTLYEKNQLHLNNKLGIEVSYLGNSDININFLNICTPNARSLYFGYKDTLIVQSAQADLDWYSDASFSSHGVKPFRFFLRDEINEAFFGQARYINKLIGNITTTQSGLPYPYLYYYYTNSPEDWVEQFGPDGLISVPYSRYGNQDPSSAGLKWGFHCYNKSADPIKNADTLNSDYETFLTINKTIKLDSLRKTLDLKWYRDEVLHNAGSFLTHLECILYDHFVIFKHAPIYGNKFWWSETFIGSTWKMSYDSLTRKQCSMIEGIRPKTGEEIRLFTSLPILMGAKGLLYDREQSVDSTDFEGIGNGQEFYNTHKYNGDSLNNIPNNQFLELDMIGSDFLTIGDTTDYTKIDRYLCTKLDSVLGIERDRVYIGRKSSRLEIFKKHLWVKQNDSILMRLKLVCWYGKGFKTWYNQDTARFGNENLFKKFFTNNQLISEQFIIDTSKIKIRPIGRDTALTPIKPWERLPYYEPFDSTFFDIAIHRDMNDTNLTSKTWYFAIQNRRTSPLVRPFDTLLFTYPYSIDSSLKFYSTAEFDSYVVNGGKRLNGDSMPASYWKNLFWKRAGAREFNIPFNFKYSPDDRKYALLHITELGANDSLLNTLTWRQKEFYHKIDTIIGQDKSLCVRLLPGDFKFFKVTVIPPDTTTHGELTFSNQRKLVGYPVTDSNIVITKDSLYYHMAYHRKNLDGTSKVYYRRSLLVNHNLNDTITNSSNIIWGPEKSISDSIHCRDSVVNLLQPADCKYPSLVVRYDSVSNKAKVYIVFVCSGRQICVDEEPLLCPNSYTTIVENIVNANDNMQFFNPSQVIAYACGSNYEKFGVPMINASKYVNYYIWADSLKGITTAWKRPNDVLFNSNFDFTLSSFKFRNFLGFEATQPSLNSYSRIRLNEQNCAAIWREKDSSGINSPYGVYHTLLKPDYANFKTIHYLPLSMKQKNLTNLFNQDSSIVKLSYALESNSFPVIFRSVEDTLYTGLDVTYDVCSWEAFRTDSIKVCENGYLDKKRFVNSTTIQYSNLYSLFNIEGKILPRSRIMSLNNSLSKPNLSQGAGQEPNSYNGNPREVILNFMESDTCKPDSIYPYRIWQYPHGYSVFQSIPWNIIGNFYNYANFTTASIINDNARIPQLAARPYMRSFYEWWQNRRVFETDSSISDIYTSSKGFYKKVALDMKPMPFLGFYNNNGSSLIGLLSVNDKIINFDFRHIFPEFYDKKVNRARLSESRFDTIPTEWFNIGNNNQLGFFCYGMNTSDIKQMIQRKSDNKMVELNSERVEEKTIRFIYYNLVNGENELYRFLLIRKNRNLEFLENIIIMNSIYPENYFTKLPESDSYYDLNSLNKIENTTNNITLSLYPNPAENTIFITSYLPKNEYSSKINIRIFSNFGIEQFRLEVKSGETIQIPTDQLPNGAYFIRAEQKTTEYGKLPLTTFESFIISR